MCVTRKKLPMGQDDKIPKCKRIGGGDGDSRRANGRQCKKPNLKKVPQRGLGVAQLEKLRLEEEQKVKAVAAATTTAISSSPNSNTPYDKHLQFPKIHHSNKSSSPNSLPPSIVSIANSGAFDASRHDAPVPGHVSGLQLRGPHDFEFGKNFGMNPGLTFPSNFPCEPYPIMPFPNWVQKTKQQQPSSSMVSVFSRTLSKIVPHSSLEPSSNETYVSKRWIKMIGIKRSNPFPLNIPPVSSSNFKPYDSNPIRPFPNWMHITQQHPSSPMLGVSSKTSSTIVPHFSSELPSNQNNSGSYVSKRKEEKMIWTKRPNPFSLDIPPTSSSNYKPLTFLAPMKASESISCSSGRRFNLDFGNSTLREMPSLSASNLELISKKNKKGKKNIGGDFPKMAPPSQCSCSKLKSPSGFVPFCHQGQMKDQVPPPSRYNQTNQQQHWYNVIPSSSKVAQIGQQSDRFENYNVVGESVDLDLSLKLWTFSSHFLWCHF